MRQLRRLVEANLTCPFVLRTVQTGFSGATVGQPGREAPGQGKEYDGNRMKALKAQVRGGRLVLDEPTELPEGAEVELTLVEDDGMDSEERVRLLKELDESQAEYERGEHDNAFEFLAQLRAGR